MLRLWPTVQYAKEKVFPRLEYNATNSNIFYTTVPKLKSFCNCMINGWEIADRISGGVRPVHPRLTLTRGGHEGRPAYSMSVPWRLQKGGKLMQVYARVIHGDTRCGIDLSRDST